MSVVQEVGIWRDLGEYAELTALEIREQALDTDDSVLVKAQITSLTTYVYDITETEESATNVGSPITHTVASVWFDTLQAPTGDNPTDGYNVKYSVPGSYFTGTPNAEKKYRIQTWAVVTSGANFWVSLCIVTIKDTLAMPIP